MTAVTAFPYLRPRADTVRATDWTDTVDEPLPLEEGIRGWDPWTEIVARRTVTVDLPSVLSACQLGDGACLRLAAAWYSPHTALRERGCVVDLRADSDARDVSLEMNIPGHRVAGQVELQTRLVIADPGEGQGPLAPAIPGSILWADSFTLKLEGHGPRFPVEVLDFPHAMEAAGWSLSIAPELEFPFLGGVRLYINGRNQAVRAAIESTSPGRAEGAIIAAIYADTARQLVRFALSSEEFLERTKGSPQSCPFEQDTTGHALWALLAQLFPGKAATELARQLQNSPEHFDTLVQGRVRILEGV